MISDLAISEIERLEKAGLKPTAADIIRLNALGLHIEHVKGPGDIFTLPRVANLGDLHFREPTIAHDMWIEEALGYVDRTHLPTYLTVCAYALSRSQDLLPDVGDRKAVLKALRTFSRKMLKDYTFHQLRVAVMYAMHGADHVAQEYPAPANAEDDPLGRYLNAPRSVGAGVLVSTAAMALGLSVRDISSLTLAQALEVRKLAMIRIGCDLNKNFGNKASDEFFRTVAEIESRLQKEKEAKDGGGKNQV